MSAPIPNPLLDAFCKRIDELVDELRIPHTRKFAEIAKRTGINKSTVQNWFKGRARSPSAAMLEQLADGLGTTASWLWKGQRPKHRESLVSSFDPDTADFNHLRSEDVASHTHGVQTVTQGNPNALAEVVNRAGLGPGEEFQQAYVVERDGVKVVDAVKPEPWVFPSSFVRENLKGRASRMFVMETRGDSMAPTIVDGDFVIIDTAHVIVSPDGLYAMRDIYGGIEVKRLQKVEGGILKQSDNPKHKDELLKGDDINIVGRVVMYVRKI